MLKVGMHQAFDGLANAVIDANVSGNETFQIFTRNNRNMKSRTFLAEDFEDFNKHLRLSLVEDFVVHAPYAMNPASCDSDILSRTVKLIQGDMHVLNHLDGNIHYVVHPGSSTEYEPTESMRVLIKTLHELQSSYGKVKIAIENMAGMGTQLISSLQEWSQLLFECVDIPNFEVCIDTCHAFGAGTSVDKMIGLLKLSGCADRLGVIHVNDSRYGFGCNLDRHANIGRGVMGDTLKQWVTVLHDFAPNAPLILETPVEFQADDVETVRDWLA